MATNISTTKFTAYEIYQAIERTLPLFDRNRLTHVSVSVIGNRWYADVMQPGTGLTSRVYLKDA